MTITMTTTMMMTMMMIMHIDLLIILGLGSLNGDSWASLRQPLKEAMMTTEAVEVLFLPWINEVQCNTPNGHLSS